VRNDCIVGKLSERNEAGDEEAIHRRNWSCVSGVGVESEMGGPLTVGKKVLCDALNIKIVQNFTSKTKQPLQLYHADDHYCGNPSKSTLRKRNLRAPSNLTNDSLGILPLVSGMKVIVTDNAAICGGIVNGCQGIL